MKTNAKRIFGIIAIFTALCLYGCYVPTEEEKEKEETLVDTTSEIPAGKVATLHFTVPYSTSSVTVDVSVNVTSGDGVKMYLVDDNNLTKLLANESFQYHSVLSADYKFTSFTKSATLTSGSWNIAVVNPNTLLSQTVSRKIVAKIKNKNY